MLLGAIASGSPQNGRVSMSICPEIITRRWIFLLGAVDAYFGYTPKQTPPREQPLPFASAPRLGALCRPAGGRAASCGRGVEGRSATAKSACVRLLETIRRSELQRLGKQKGERGPAGVESVVDVFEYDDLPLITA